MTFEELKTLFQSYTGVGETEVEDIELALWFNEAQAELALDFGEVDTEALVADTAEALPTDLLKIISVKDSDGAIVAYKVSDDSYITADAASTLYYRKSPADFTGLSLSAESTLPTFVHRLMALFASSRYWDKESEGDTEESNHANKWMGYYLNEKQTALKKLSFGGSQPKYWTVV